MYLHMYTCRQLLQLLGELRRSTTREPSSQQQAHAAHHTIHNNSISSLELGSAVMSSPDSSPVEGSHGDTRFFLDLYHRMTCIEVMRPAGIDVSTPSNVTAFFFDEFSVGGPPCRRFEATRKIVNRITINRMAYQHISAKLNLAVPSPASHRNQPPP